MDALIIVLIIFIAVFFVKRTFSGVIYAFAIVDIFLRIMTFIKYNISEKDISNLIQKYLPENIPAIISKYTDGVLTTILLWIYLIAMAIFLFYIIRTFIRKK